MLEPILVIQDFNTLSLEQIKSRYRDVSITDQSGKTLLFYAIQVGRMDVFNDLLKRGIRLSTVDDQGETVIFGVIRRQQLRMLKILIQLNINVSHVNDMGQTPLHIAAQSGHIEIIQALRESQAMHTKDLLGRYPIHEAVLNGKLQALIWFYEHDQQSLFTLTDDDFSCLHLAVTTFNIDLIQYLIDQKLDVNGLTQFYDTPLHFAVRYDHDEAVELLLKAHAFMDIPNKHGVTPEEESESSDTIKKLFQTYMFDPSYEAHMKTYARIHAILRRDRKKYLSLDSHFAPDPFDQYQKKARDYITHYQLEKKFKHS